jgi:uracil-DNA glycosylase
MTDTYGSPETHGAECSRCPLQGSKVVPPEGNPKAARIAIVGESPGFVEVKTARPFSGPSGKGLDEILMAVRLKRSEVFITNVALCRPETPGLEGKIKFDVPTYLAWLRLENKRRMKSFREAKKAGQAPPLPDLLSNPFECCRVRLAVELEMLEQAAVARGQPNGAIVIPLGNEALFAIAGRRKIMRWRGSPIPISSGGEE